MDYTFPRCRIEPLPDWQVEFRVEGRPVLRWHHNPAFPRPFFYPLLGPSGIPLTRMGHPGAPDHDHHRSIWFGHQRVQGVDFWSDRTAARIAQQQWLCFEDHDSWCAMAVTLAWADGHDPRPLMTQELVAIVHRAAELLGETAEGEVLLELQSRFIPTSEVLELGKTNFGLLGIRMAASISAVFGGGLLRGSNGAQGESELFGKALPWVDYSGPVRAESGKGTVWEGITCLDHPDNPGFPARWHVRDDGWMGPSLCRERPLLIRQSNPLLVRYALWAHRGPCPASERIARVQQWWHAASPWQLARGPSPHKQYRLLRAQ